MKSATKFLSIAIICLTAYLNADAQVNLNVKDVWGFGNPVNMNTLSFQVGFLVQNTGTIPVTDITFGYICSGPPVSETWNGNLAPNDTLTIYMTAPFTTLSGPYTVQAGVGDVNGTYIGDSLVFDFYGQSAATGVLIDNFENALYEWRTNAYENSGTLPQIIGDQTSNWQLGTPNYGVTTGAQSGFKAWDINLNTAPDSSETSYLYSPIISLTNSTYPYLDFWQNRSTSAGQNGLRIEYNTDSLTWDNWTDLGIVNDPNATNWFTSSSLASSGKPGWDGNSGGWINSKHDLSSFIGSPYLQFRFVYSTNATGMADDGVSIDDFMLCNIIASANTTNLLCNGSSSGTVNLAVTGGVSPYSFQWSNGITAMGATVTGLAAGTYSCLITDVTGCTANIIFTISEPPAISVSVSNSSTPCGSATGTVTANVVGGTAPYNYIWSNGATGGTINGLPFGTYIITVTDMNGCTAIGSGMVSSSNGPVGSLDSIISPACTGGSNGAIYISTTGGTSPYNYIWSNGTSTEDNTGLSKGAYTVIITDNNTCQNIFSFNLTEKLPAAGISITQQPSSCGACDGVASAFATGGTSPYTFLWNTLSTVQVISNLCTGSYFCTITDVNGCSTQSSISLQTSGFTVTATSTPAGCGMNDGAANAVATGGTGGYTYLWSNGSITSNITSLNAGIYIVSVYDANNCFATASVLVDDSCHGVWPGDANYDLQADNSDLLNIGIAYGSTGPIRPGASLAWVPQPCSNWNGNFVTGANYKNADCNGDGVIDDNDTTAILLNYGNTHPFKQFPVPLSLPGSPDLFLVVSVDSTGLSDTIIVEVNLGNGNIPVDSIYGLAFSIQADPQLLDTSFALVDFSNCWLGTNGSDLLSISKNRINEGALDLALVRTDHNNVSGSGPIARATLVTTDNIAGKLTSPTSAPLTFSISNVSAITSNENEIFFNEIPDTVIIDSAYVAGISVHHHNYAPLVIAPNPADQVTYIFHNLNPGEKVTVEMTDMLGKIVYTGLYTPASNRIKLSVASIENGVYGIRCRSEKRISFTKLVVQH